MSRHSRRTDSLTKSPRKNAFERYGGVAQAIRDGMARKGLSAAELGRLVSDAPGGATAPYGWLALKGAPGVRLRPRVAAVLEIDEALLRPKAMLAATAERNAAWVAVKPVAVTPLRRDVSPLTFTILDDGTTRISLNLTLPLAAGSRVFEALVAIPDILPSEHNDRSK